MKEKTKRDIIEILNQLLLPEVLQIHSFAKSFLDKTERVSKLKIINSKEMGSDNE